MTQPALHIINKLRDRGLTVSVPASVPIRLKLEPKTLITDKMRQVVNARRDDLVLELLWPAVSCDAITAILATSVQPDVAERNLLSMAGE